MIGDSRITLQDRSRDVELNAAITSAAPTGHDKNSRVLTLEGTGSFQGQELELRKHLDLWHVKRKPQLLAHGPPADQLPLYDDASGPSVDDLLVDPQYPVESYF